MADEQEQQPEPKVLESERQEERERIANDERKRHAARGMEQRRRMFGVE